MMKRSCLYLFTALLLVLVSSCSSTGNMKKGTTVGNLSEAEYMEELINRLPAWDAVTAKMSLAVDLNGKGPTRVSGTLRMKRDEVIQLSVTPFLGIEVARAEISPDGVLVMDRMNKRYVQVSFRELKALANVDLDFHVLQSLFLNEIFLPGKKTLTARDVAAFAVTPENENAVVRVKNSKRIDYRFSTGMNDGRLKESHIGVSGTRYGVNWRYDKFRPLGQKQFPASMLVAFEGADKPVTALFELSRLSTDKDWTVHTEVPGKYERIELSDLIKQLLKK
ncbi:MAG: DUF4292 domain-containing protein [Phocaeicola sp.]|uniref:DUF4292 domain-containing protein n=1 Tax=Phocaeicola sp. TaxID=2773926 RepID=UPI0023C91D48|nr:DUF4292 domain-containing protein [Phocaeicola sp.]MDE5676501.1 DUF4292 domain-containing protein [Phocaeicola sp.]MDE6180545.1 DUF4292 domain-containing protein [Phocaeicola sp.]